jgi:fluoride ion exporter CrcB/FEX
VKFGLNLLHLVLLASTLACIRLTLVETRGRSLRRGRLAWSALLALLCAGIFLLFHVGVRQPPWVFGAALAAGVLGGVTCGCTVAFEVDHMFDKIRLPQARVPLAVALLLAVALVFEVAGSLLGANGTLLRIAAPPLAAAGAGFLAGRAAAIALRCRRAPHVVLHRF